MHLAGTTSHAANTGRVRDVATAGCGTSTAGSAFTDAAVSYGEGSDSRPCVSANATSRVGTTSQHGGRTALCVASPRRAVSIGKP